MQAQLTLPLKPLDPHNYIVPRGIRGGLNQNQITPREAKCLLLYIAVHFTLYSPGQMWPIIDAALSGATCPRHRCSNRAQFRQRLRYELAKQAREVLISSHIWVGPSKFNQLGQIKLFDLIKLLDLQQSRSIQPKVLSYSGTCPS